MQAVAKGEKLAIKTIDGEAAGWHWPLAASVYPLVEHGQTSCPWHPCASDSRRRATELTLM